MFDRLISGAGAVTDAADRMVRALGRGGGEGFLGHRPGSIAVAAICAVLAGILVFAGLEATDNPTPQAMSPAQVAAATDLGSRTYATVEGGISATYVETYTDDNGNGTQEAGETGISWFYFLVDPVTKAGVAVRSKEPPAKLFTYEATGTVTRDPEYVAQDISYFAEEATSLGFTLDRDHYLDSTAPADPSAPLVDLADGTPTATTPIRLSDSRAGGYLQVCSDDANGDGACNAAEVDRWEIAMYDPASGNAITVLVDRDPGFTKAAITGMLRRDEHAVSEAKTTEGLDFSTTGLDISDVYLLEDGSSPASAPLAFGLAALLGLVAGSILIGLAGGYLVYRKSTDRLPAPATTLAIGERIPVRVTGDLRAGAGLIHVREAPADLVRFQTSGPTPTIAAPTEVLATAEVPEAAEWTTSAEPEPIPPAEAPATVAAPPASVASTVILERRGRPEGVALGRGELTRLSRGSVLPFKGRRPAIRATAGTGPVLLSFDSEAERDRAVAELLGETGLTAGDHGSAHA